MAEQQNHVTSINPDYQPINDPRTRLLSSSSSGYGTQSGSFDKKKLSESKSVRRWRYFSIVVMLFLMFNRAASYTIVIASVWPFYEKIDDDASQSFLGLILAAYGIGQLIIAPFFGLWANYRPIAEPLQFSLFITALGGLLYGYTEAFDGEGQGKWILFAGRLTMGLGTGNITLLRLYLAIASYEDERNTVMALLSAMQGVGFILGPVLGLMFQPLGEEGFEWSAVGLHFNLYSAPGYFVMLLSLINMLAVALFFHEYDVYQTRRVVTCGAIWNWLKSRGESSEDEDDEDDNGVDAERGLLPKNPSSASLLSNGTVIKYDRLATYTCIVMFCVILAMFTAVETLLTPLAQDQYGWSKKDATLYVNVISSFNAIVAIAVYMAITYIVRWVAERILFMTGYILMIIGFVVWSPYGPDYPDVEIIALNNASGYPVINNGTREGCKMFKQTWCTDVPKIYLPQYIAGLFIVTAGYCLSNLLCTTLFSKIVGPQRQGLLMGYFSSSGSTGRMLGPLVLAFVYHKAGPRWAFIVCIGSVAVVLAMLILFYRRYVPYSEYHKRIKANKVKLRKDAESTIVNSNDDT